MAEEKKEEKPRVNLEDVVEVLAKHSASPTDPDDAETLANFNQQVADDKAKAAESSSSTPTTSGKAKP